MTDDVHDVIIIGSGPAGYTAAIYAARAQLNPIVFEGVQSGGALMTTTEIENFPGFVEGTMGPDLMSQMREQAARFGSRLHPVDATALQLDAAVKTVVAQGITYRARAVVLAMGAAVRYLDVEGEQRLLGHGVSSCATCDGFFFRDRDVAVIGGGDSAMEEAVFLTRYAKSVTVVHRRTEFRASRIMVDRARQNSKIKWADPSEVVSVLGETRVKGLRLSSVETNSQIDLAVDGVFVAIGHEPRNELVRGQVALDGEGYVEVVGRTSHTGIPGVFACGDLVDSSYRQAITAAGSGCVAALDVERYLADLEDDPATAHSGSMPNAPILR
jgi:thioredoxin reductase (NADPH)